MSYFETLHLLPMKRSNTDHHKRSIKSDVNAHREFQSDLPDLLNNESSIPVLYWARIVKLITQRFVRVDVWVSTNGNPLCWC